MAASAIFVSNTADEPALRPRKLRPAPICGISEADMAKLARRQFLQLAVVAGALPVVSGIARAQTYPTRPVRIIVGYAAGGGIDLVARLMGQFLSERFGRQFIIENRPGAGSNVGTEAVVKAPPDGYTLLLVAPANAINATLYDTLNYNFIRDIAPVAGIIRMTNVMVVHPSVPAKTVPEFIAHSKANPGKINFASGGIGGGQHVSGELFKMMAGVDDGACAQSRRGTRDGRSPRRASAALVRQRVNGDGA